MSNNSESVVKSDSEEPIKFTRSRAPSPPRRGFKKKPRSSVTYIKKSQNHFLSFSLFIKLISEKLEIYMSKKQVSVKDKNGKFMMKLQPGQEIRSVQTFRKPFREKSFKLGTSHRKVICGVTETRKITRKTN